MRNLFQLKLSSSFQVHSRARMTAVQKPQRVLVKLRKAKENVKSAHFTQCILDYFGFSNGTGRLFAYMEDKSLVLSDAQQTKEESAVLKHPSFCPFYNLTQSDIESIPSESATRGVDVGAAVLVESCDGKVLLVKRAKHLRTFPGIWVPPGGHLEIGESLAEGGLREVKEETGLQITLSDCLNEQVKLIGLWESAFPPKLSCGLPKRHHVVTYLHAVLKHGLTADVMEKRIKFDPQEVEACAWLNKDFISAIVSSNEENETSVQQNNLPSKFRVLAHLNTNLELKTKKNLENLRSKAPEKKTKKHTYSQGPQSKLRQLGLLIKQRKAHKSEAIAENEQKEQVSVELPTAPLLATMGEDSSGERVSTGTKFALEQCMKI